MKIAAGYCFTREGLAMLAARDFQVLSYYAGANPRHESDAVRLPEWYAGFGPQPVRAKARSMGSGMVFAVAALALLGIGAGNPVFVTSAPNGGWSEGGYYVHNNLWNSTKYHPCTSTLSAWSQRRHGAAAAAHYATFL